MAGAEINALGGIKGDSLRLEFADDSADEARAIEVARQLRENPAVSAVVGHVNSKATLAAAVIYNGASGGTLRGDPVLEISPASSAPELTRAGEWTFRLCPTDLEFSPVMARWALGTLGKRRAAILYANDQYGNGVYTTFADAFAQGGGSVVGHDPYLPEIYTNDSTLDPYITRALRAGADALVIGGQAPEGLKIIRAARRLGYTGAILGADGLTGVKDGGPVAEGVYVTSAFLPDRNNEKAQQFVNAYRQRYNNELPDHRGAMTYDAVYLLKQAVEQAGSGRRSLRDYVASIGMPSGRPAFEGVSGTIRFDRNGDVVGKEVAMGVVRGGHLVTAR
jgi:branched-chain amino acid transport system substrate-binding protein